MPHALPTDLRDFSGTVTSGGTAQTVLTDNRARQYLLVQNVSSGDIWVNFSAFGASSVTAAVANQPSIKLAPGAALEYSGGGTVVVPRGAMSLIGATTGQAFTCKVV